MHIRNGLWHKLLSGTHLLHTKEGILCELHAGYIVHRCCPDKSPSATFISVDVRCTSSIICDQLVKSLSKE